MKQLLFITHRKPDYGYVESARLALKGGCRWIQLRMKNATEKEIENNLRQLKPLCAGYSATLILNDHTGIALRMGIDGVHLGKNDMDVAEARKLAGKGFIIGGTANTFNDIVTLVGKKADYIGLGPFRFTTTKEKLSPVLGIEGYQNILAQCCKAGIDIPIIAIGGILREDIPTLLQTGVAGIAVSSGILAAADPVRETKRIIETLNMSIKKMKYTL